MAIKSAYLNFQFSIVEELEGLVDGLSLKQVTHDALGKTALNLSGTTTPPVVRAHTDTKTGGAATIDLTAMPTITGNYDATGKKLRAILVECKTGSLGKLTVGPGGVNPYPLFGTGITPELPVSGRMMVYFADGLPAVAAGVKNITFTPTNAADSFDVILVVG